MNDLEWMDFSRLMRTENGFSKLFSDYVNDFHKVKKFYGLDFRAQHSFQVSAEKRLASYSHRGIVCEVVREQNLQFGASEKTKSNIDLLGSENAVAVVTGQQVGMLGGPLYTIFKTITCIKLADQLNEQFPAFHFIPVFWLEGEDHDFEEVNKVSVLTSEFMPSTIEYTPKSRKGQRNFGAVGTIATDETVSTFLDDLSKLLVATEFKPALFEHLQSFYCPPSTFMRGFVSFLNLFVGAEGVVFIDSSDPRLKKVVAPIFAKEINEFPKVSQLIIRQSAALEEEYHAQIKTRAMNLFMFHEGGRYFLEPREHDFVLRGTRKSFSKEELLRVVDSAPESFSPNVALRPICQDTLLPTVTYVAGPSEIAYFAQLKPVYDYFSCHYPILYPRASATIVEERQMKILDKFQLGLSEVLEQPDKISKKVIGMMEEVKLEELFGETTNHILDAVNELKFGLNYIDPTLMGPLESTREKIESLIRILREKTAEAQQRKHEIALRQIQKVLNSLLPNGIFQERALNAVYFLNKYGPEFPELMKGKLHIGQFQHQIIYL